MNYLKETKLSCIALFGFLFFPLMGESSKLDKVLPLLEKYCFSCHGNSKSKGGISLNGLDGSLTKNDNAKLWGEISKALSSGDMPPEDELQPKASLRKAVIKLIDSELKLHIVNNPLDSNAKVARRLTNFEYQNTMRDLLGVDLNFTEFLHRDPDKPYTFNNSAAMLILSTEQLVAYEEAARKALNSVIVDPKKPQVHKFKQSWDLTRPKRVQAKKDKKGRLIKQHPLAQAEVSYFGAKGNSQVKIKKFPEKGEFLLRMKLSTNIPKEFSEFPFRIIMGMEQSYDLPAKPFQEVFFTTLGRENTKPQIFEIRGRIENLPVQPARSYRRGGRIDGNLVHLPAHISLYFQNLFDDGTLGIKPYPDLASKPTAIVEWLEFEAPVVDTWPPKHHTDILFKSNLKKINTSGYVKEVLKRFMMRAFRRIVLADEVENYYKIFKISAGNNSFENAIRDTLTMVLISPDFLYHVRTNNKILSSYEMASRLSYFLWGTMPDDELMTLAKEKKLTDNHVIEAQVLRMLEDKRSKNFVKNFTNQWLSIEKAKSIPIDRAKFPNFLIRSKRRDRMGAEVSCFVSIRDDMMQETTSFIGELIKRNANVLNIIHSDFAMLNYRLAKHYGVEGVTSAEIKPIALKKGHNLGGLLTQGSFLTANSTGTTPHPIYRAVWLREAILGDKVEEPPADIPALSDSVGPIPKNTSSIAEMLKIHRQKKNCNVCHAKLDPWGIPFEEYNAIGKYAPNNSVNMKVKVPNGPYVSSVKELKKHLIEDRKTDIAKNVLKRLTEYGLGRELSIYDKYEFETLLQKSADKGHKIRDMIILICKSRLFTGG